MNYQPSPPNPYDPTVQNPRVLPETRQEVHGALGQQVSSGIEYVEDKSLMRANQRYRITRVVYFVLGVLEVIMGLRLVFRLLGANQGSDFVMFLYSLSHIFVSPFSGIFNDQTIGNVSVFEISTVIAMLVYALVAWGLAELGKVLLTPSQTPSRRIIKSQNSRTTP
jgi:hypothetical protein